MFFACPFSLTPRVDYDLVIQFGKSGTIGESNQASGVRMVYLIVVLRTEKHLFVSRNWRKEN